MLALNAETNKILIASDANLKAGACVDCDAGGKSCDLANTATGTVAGTACSPTGSVRRDCPGTAGTASTSSLNSTTSITAGPNVACAPATTGYECVGNPPGPSGPVLGATWKVATIGCGVRATCDASGRELNDPKCQPPDENE